MKSPDFKCFRQNFSAWNFIFSSPFPFSFFSFQWHKFIHPCYFCDLDYFPRLFQTITPIAYFCLYTKACPRKMLLFLPDPI